jgi:PAS domain S-box-containing protein
MDAIADAILLVDRSSMRFVYVNDAACRHLNLTRMELLAKDPWVLVSTPRQMLEATYDRLIAGGAAGKLEEMPLRMAGGPETWVEVRRQALRLEDRWTIITIVHDVTERRRQAQELRESERRFSDLLGNVELASVMLDRNAKITYCNDYLLRLTGWQREEVIGRDWFEAFMPEELGDMKPVFQALLNDLPEARHRDNEIFTRSGERRLIRWNNSVLRSGAGEVIGVASVGEDITDRRKAEEILERRAAELERFHRLSVGRELQMIALKREVNELARQAGRALPYDLAFLGSDATTENNGHGPGH